MQKPYNISLIFSLALTTALYSTEPQNEPLLAPPPQETYMEEAPAKNNEPPVSAPTPAPTPAEPKEIEHFTGKISRNRVRLRLQPSLESPILKELNRDDFFIVTSVVDDFYAVLPPEKLKGYVFRTYVLDGVIEGSHVNVRLEPDTNSPILCQLNAGEKIEGKISPQSNKWLEITLPEKVRFFVAKEYVNRIGDANLFYSIEKKRSQITARLAKIELLMKEELKKPFKEIQPAPIVNELTQLAKQAQELPTQKEKAEMLIQKMQESYLQKSVANKQAKPEKAAAPKPSIVATGPQNDDPAEQEAPIVAPNKAPQIAAPSQKQLPSIPAPGKPNDFWVEQEQRLIKEALDAGQTSSPAEFYSLDEQLGYSLTGIVKPNLRPVKNSPGDFLLIDPETNLPIGYLYSTKIDLHNYIGRQITVVVSERPNNNFAYPAYFVLKVE